MNERIFIVAEEFELLDKPIFIILVNGVARDLFILVNGVARDLFISTMRTTKNAD